MGFYDENMTFRIVLLCLLFTTTVCSQETEIRCIDWEGREVGDGEQFQSRMDPCETCTCEGGHSVRCMAVRCAPPDCNMWELIEGVCCDFHCLEPADAPNGGNGTGYIPGQHPDTLENENLGLRLVASTVTSFLILALLLFMVHRLRQRRILIMMQRMNDEQLGEDSVAYMSQFDHVDMGIEFPPYEDPPPPYTPAKPPELPPGEAPPPYEPPGNNNNDPGTDGYGPLLGRGRPAQAPLNIPGLHTRPPGGVMTPSGLVMWESLRQNNASVRGGEGTDLVSRLSAITEPQESPVNEEPAGVAVDSTAHSPSKPAGFRLAVALPALPSASNGHGEAGNTDSMKKPPHSPLLTRSLSVEVGSGSPHEEERSGQGCLLGQSWHAGDSEASPAVPTTSHYNMASQQPAADPQLYPGLESLTCDPVNASHNVSLTGAVTGRPSLSYMADPLEPSHGSEPPVIMDTSSISMTSGPSAFTTPESPLSPSFAPFGQPVSMHSEFSMCSETGDQRSSHEPAGMLNDDRDFVEFGNHFVVLPSPDAVAAPASKHIDNGYVLENAQYPRHTSRPYVNYMDQNENLPLTSPKPSPPQAGGRKATPGKGKSTKTRVPDREGGQARVTKSPGSRKAPSLTPYLSYKEYGFIDDPNATTALPNTNNVDSSIAAEQRINAKAPQPSHIPNGSMKYIPERPSKEARSNAKVCPPKDSNKHRSRRNKKNGEGGSTPKRKQSDSSVSQNVYAGHTEQPMQLGNESNDNCKDDHIPRSSHKEGRPLERDGHHSSSSLERKRKRPFNRERVIPQPEVLLETILAANQEKTVSSDTKNSQKNKPAKRPVKRVSRDKQNITVVLNNRGHYVNR